MSIEISALEPLTTPTTSDKLIIYDEDSANEYKTEGITIGNLLAGLAFILNPQKYTSYNGASANAPDIALNKLNAYYITGAVNAAITIPLSSSVPEGSGTIVYCCSGSRAVGISTTGSDVFYSSPGTDTEFSGTSTNCYLLFAVSDGYWVLRLGD